MPKTAYYKQWRMLLCPYDRLFFIIVGYFEQEKIKKISAPKHKVLEAKNYSIEDKRYE